MMEMSEIIRKLVAIIDEQKAMRKKVEAMIDEVRQIKEDIAGLAGAKNDNKSLLSEFTTYVASMTDDDVRASIQNAERLTAGCDKEDGGAEG